MPGGSERTKPAQDTQKYVRHILDSSVPKQGTSSTTKVIGKLGDFPSLVARGRSRAAGTTQNTSQP